ncbi:MAG: thioredoxin fold domain-containing protein [Gammaproteobacteria bacterium]|nr:thioredoxin fold domain-containing protein [Gammaproteobacteria bacterium]
MKLYYWLGLCLFLLASPVFAKEPGELAEGMVNPGFHEKPEWFKNSFLDLNEDIAEARESGKKLIVFFYQDGCPYCKKILDDNFSQKDIADKTRKHFDLVAVNMWGDNELVFRKNTFTEKSFSEVAKVMYTPTILFFDEKSNIVLRMNGYYQPGKFEAALDYVRLNKFTYQKFSEYMAEVTPVKSAGKLHKSLETVDQPYQFRQALKKGKPLVVMFEQKQCPACDELHLDTLMRDQSKKLLKPFEIAVVDMWSDESIIKPDGGRSKMSSWAKELDIQYAPSLVFFDRDGKDVFRIEGYLKSFHVQSVLDYVAQQAYIKHSNFQRWIDQRAHRLRDQGIEVDLMK